MKKIQKWKSYLNQCSNRKKQIIVKLSIIFILIIIILLYNIYYSIFILGVINKIDKPKYYNESFIIRTLKPIEEIKDINKESLVVLEEESEPTKEYEFSDEERYLLAKIAMAEAEDCNQDTKICVVSCILNRVKDEEFPNSISEVIYQKTGNIYQFSPIGNGRWDRVEPNEDCYDAVNQVEVKNDYPSILYFESCENQNNWHSRNLSYVCEYSGMRFYQR